MLNSSGFESLKFLLSLVPRPHNLFTKWRIGLRVETADHAGIAYVEDCAQVGVCEDLSGSMHLCNRHDAARGAGDFQTRRCATCVKSGSAPT
jgi:hypothetical protein